MTTLPEMPTMTCPAAMTLRIKLAAVALLGLSLALVTGCGNVKANSGTAINAANPQNSTLTQNAQQTPNAHQSPAPTAEQENSIWVRLAKPHCH